MVSDTAVFCFACSLIFIIGFFVWSRKKKKNKVRLLHNLFIVVAVSYMSWVIPLLIMRFVSLDSKNLLFILDCAMQPGGALLPLSFLCMAVTFTKGYEKMPKWMSLLFLFPILTVLVSWTNPLHHLYYKEFSVVRSEIEFGPYILVSGLVNYSILVAGIIYLVRFGIKNRNSLYWKQCVTFILGGLCPVIVNMYATFSGSDVPITATPMSFMVTMVCDAIVIFQLYILDIKPIATQHILDAISDSYLVLSDTGHVIKYNKSFKQQFAEVFGITENCKLADVLKKEGLEQTGFIYNVLNAINSGMQGEYEQNFTAFENGSPVKKYFVVNISEVTNNNQMYGYVILFKDITQIKDSMRKLQDSQERMMEQERFAFLGQMIGGLAHNLKTPIMSISGCISAAEALVEECEDSLEDPDVNNDDYREIYAELRDWFNKVKESTSYMSDIITAIKGQAANISTDDKITFTVDEMLKRCKLLMRHELQNSGCKLEIDYDEKEEISLQGDINNLVQVLNNLLSNSIFASKQNGGGIIEIQICRDDKNLNILVKDRGPGISDSVKSKLFKTMVTSKGTMGTGLGLYISNAVIRGKFNGEMWGDNREDGGSVFGIAIPLDMVHIRPMVVRNLGE